jgi:SAM-dependent methyltransferase
VVEVGCGTGAASIPLARLCKRLVGLDIDGNSILVANARAEHYGASENVTFLTVAPEELLDRALSCEPEANVFVLYAVLEHLTPSERLHYLRVMWQTLPMHGAIVVIETPNRLTWEDKHTAYMDFFHMLPDEYVSAYSEKSPRSHFAETMRQLAGPSFRESRYRWGLGASFHEFELAFKENLNEILVADGLEQEMIDMFLVEEDELALRRYFLARSIDQPIGFSRAVLNLIFRKPASLAERQANVAYNEHSLALARANSDPVESWFSRMGRQFRRKLNKGAVVRELNHAKKIADDRYVVIQEMDRMVRQRDAEISRLRARLGDANMS